MSAGTIIPPRAGRESASPGRPEQMDHEHDYKSHEEMWRNFVRLLLWAAGATAAVLALMAVVLL